MTGINASVHISSNGVYVNGEKLGDFANDEQESSLKKLYVHLGLSYPKFHKMDSLAQAGFLAIEVLKQHCSVELSQYEDDEIALFFGNSSSSLDTDLKFESSYQNQGSPSPSLFVYTLPNIILGEIAIANKWYGENMFVVLPAFSSETFYQYSRILLDNGAKAVIAGWVEVLEEYMDVFVYLVTENSTDFNIENLNSCRLKIN